MDLTRFLNSTSVLVGMLDETSNMPGLYVYVVLDRNPQYIACKTFLKVKLVITNLAPFLVVQELFMSN